MAKTETKLNWTTINTNDMPEDIDAAYRAYQAAYKAMKAAKDHFEGELREALAASTPKGKRVVFGYMFGKLSYALAEDDTKPQAKPSSAVSLSTLIKRG